MPSVLFTDPSQVDIVYRTCVTTTTVWPPVTQKQLSSCTPPAELSLGLQSPILVCEAAALDFSRRPDRHEGAKTSSTPSLARFTQPQNVVEHVSADGGSMAPRDV